jgi:integrase
MKRDGKVYKQRNCSLWYISYYHHGRRVRESTGTDNFRIAQQKLNRKLGQMAEGTFVGPHVERIRVKELAEPFLRDQTINERKGQKHAKRRWEKHLEPFFGERRVIDVGTDVLNKYVDERLKQGAGNANINREIAALRRMFRLGYYSKPQKVATLPKFPRLTEPAARKGFVEPHQYGALAAHASQLWLRAMFEVYYTYGWRKGELRDMRVRQVDFDADVIRLDVGSTKNKEGREVAMTSAVRTLLRECANDKQPQEFLFTRENGTPVKDFRKAWQSLCVQAGLGSFVCKSCEITVTSTKCQCGSRRIAYRGLIRHDLRRTAARNLRRAGVPEGVIMKIGGWKTRSVFERYAIVDQRDIRDALHRLEQAREDENCHNLRHNSSELAPQITKIKSAAVN